MMVSIYEILKDKYGEYYVSYGKKHRIKTLEKKNKKLWNDIENVYKNGFFENEYIEEQYNKYKIDYKIIYICGKKHIQFGG